MNGFGLFYVIIKFIAGTVYLGPTVIGLCARSLRSTDRCEGRRMRLPTDVKEGGWGSTYRCACAIWIVELKWAYIIGLLYKNVISHCFTFAFKILYTRLNRTHSCVVIKMIARVYSQNIHTPIVMKKLLLLLTVTIGFKFYLHHAASGCHGVFFYQISEVGREWMYCFKLLARKWQAYC